jgi:DNA recombination protein Rad52
MTFTETQNKLLAAPLDPAHVKKATGNFGPKGDYIEGWHAINELNRVFGFGGWSYQIDLTRDDLSLGKDRNGGEQWQAAYTCICTLTVGQVTRQDVGFGSGFAKGVGDAIEGATKEAATDALKRAARTFGNIFGLALYDKARANVQAPAVELITDAQRDEITLMAQGAGVPLGTICKNMNIGSLKDLPASEFAFVKGKLQETMQAGAQKEAA